MKKKSQAWLIPLPVLEIGASDGENPMDQNVDVYVREPEVGINPRREAVFIQFEVEWRNAGRHRKIAHGSDAGTGCNATFTDVVAHSEEVLPS
jgi:hypothetical protein